MGKLFNIADFTHAKDPEFRSVFSTTNGDSTFSVLLSDKMTMIEFVISEKNHTSRARLESVGIAQFICSIARFCEKAIDKLP